MAGQAAFDQNKKAKPRQATLTLNHCHYGIGSRAAVSREIAAKQLPDLGWKCSVLVTCGDAGGQEVTRCVDVDTERKKHL